jgi:monovalent cation:H+ antiporter, CPA1 family
MKLKPEQEAEAYALLRGLALLNGCPDEAIKAMVGLLDGRDIALGKVLIMDQEIGRTVYFLAKGSFSVWKRVGGDKKHLAKLTAPDFFGERSMFEEVPASALVKSDERSLVYALEKNQFDQVAAQFPGILDPIRRNMAEIRKARISPAAPSTE